MNKKKRKKIGIWIGIGGGALLILLIVCNIVGKRNPAPEVTVMEIEPRKIVSTVSGTGELRASDQVDISAEMVAKVKKLYVEEGDQVRKGQLLCVLDDVSARSTRNLNLAGYDEAKSAYERGEVLFKEELISKAEFERLRTAYQVAQSQLAQSQNQLDKTRIFAPISGRVVRLEVEEGETVMMGTMNNAGTVIITLADLSAMQARIDVDESDVVDLKLDQKAQVKLDAMPDTSFSSKVVNISYMPSTNLTSQAEGVTDFEVVLDLIDIDSAQRPGMSVSADITTAWRDSVIVCPLQAIGRREVEGKSRETVFIIGEEGKAKLVPVSTGISDGRSIEITEGLAEGDQVITGPYKVLRTLDNGSDVKILKGENEWPQSGKNGPKVKVEVGS